MEAAGAEVWGAAGGLDFEVEADDFWAGVAVVDSAGVLSRMDTMSIQRINALQQGRTIP